MPPDRRKAVRIQPYVVPCRVDQNGQTFAAYLTDLSTSGARITCDCEPPAMGAALVLDVRLDRKARPCRLPGTVQWVQPAAAQGNARFFGVTFDGATAEGQERLAAAVEEFQRRVEQLA